MLTTVLVICLILCSTVALLAGAAAWAVRRSWPRTRGTLVVQALDGDVQIIRDPQGVPHIYATTTQDLFFAQGFVHAQDRMLQMDLQRRLGLGRLSELFGAGSLGIDRRHRRVGLNRGAAQDLAALSEHSQQVLKAYAAGINEVVNRRQHPLEYVLLRARPAAWSPLDTVALAKVMQWQVGSDWSNILTRESIQRLIGPERTAELFPADGADSIGSSSMEVNPGTRSGPRETVRSLPPMPGLDTSESRGSNAWAVDSSRSASGKPIVANDMHLPLTMPGVGYQIALHAPDYHCAGLSIPGTPGILSGHNSQVAWGVATIRARVQDIYVEEPNPSEPGEYRSGQAYLPFTTVTEEISVRGRSEPETLVVRLTRHGPVISDEDALAEPDRILSLRWLAGQVPSRLIDAILAVNTAHDWDEFTHALEKWDSPMLTFVYADLDGNVGSQCAGQVPVRACGGTATPVPGWDESAEWVGTIPFAELPRTFNPASGIIVAANAKPVGPDYPYFLAPEWCTSNREQRIRERLEAGRMLTVDDMHALQLDVLSLLARRLAPLLAAAPVATPQERQAQSYLAGWDHRMEAASVAAGIYEVALRALVTRLVRPVLRDEELLESYLSREQQYSAFVADLLDKPGSAWWTAGGGQDELLTAALADATAWWTRTAGTDMGAWTWGQQHQTTFEHPIFSKIPLLRRWGNVPVGPTSGDAQTPFATGILDSLRTINGPLHRQVMDLAHWDSHRQMVAIGQSGHLLHPNYRDQATLWRDGGLHLMPWSTEAVRSAGRHTLRLVPSKAAR